MSSFRQRFGDSSNGNRSRPASRHDQDRSYGRSDPFEFSDMGAFVDDFFGGPSRGENPGYSTQEYRPQESSYAPSSPCRGRDRGAYATENVYSEARFGSAFRPSTGRRGRAGSDGSPSRSVSPPRQQRQPSPIRTYGGQYTSRGQSPGYAPRGRPVTPPPQSGGRYAGAPPRSPDSPEYQTFYPSPPKSNEKYGRQQSYREPEPPRARPGTSGNNYGTRDESSRYREPSPRAYRTQSPPREQQQRSSSSRPGAWTRSASKSRPSKSGNEKDHWYSGFSGSAKSHFERPSSKRSSSRRPESRHAPAAEEHYQPRDSSRQRGYTEDRSGDSYHRSSSARPQEGGRRREDTDNKPFDRFRQAERERSPSPEARRPQASRQEPRGYTTEEHRPGWSNAPPSGGNPYFNQQSRYSNAGSDYGGTQRPNTSRGAPPRGAYTTEEHRPGWSENAYSGATPSAGGNSYSGGGYSNAGGHSHSGGGGHSHYSNTRPGPEPQPEGQPDMPLITPERRAELKKLFDAYNARWESKTRIDPNLPMPATWAQLSNLWFTGKGTGPEIKHWTPENIVVFNVQMLFLAGFGMSGVPLVTAKGVLMVAVHEKEKHAQACRDLGKWLKRVEEPRWHPDRINARTGKEGVIDEAISKKTAVVAMRTACQMVQEACA